MTTAPVADEHPHLRERVQTSPGRLCKTPAMRGELHATGKVVRGGKRIIVTTDVVTHVAPDGTRTDCALMQQTLVPVPKTY